MKKKVGGWDIEKKPRSSLLFGWKVTEDFPSGARSENVFTGAGIMLFIRFSRM
jgi:hypothetical protein